MEYSESLRQINQISDDRELAVSLPINVGFFMRGTLRRFVESLKNYFIELDVSLMEYGKGRYELKLEGEARYIKRAVKEFDKFMDIHS